MPLGKFLGLSKTPTVVDPDETDPSLLKRKVDLRKNKNVEKDYVIHELLGSGKFGEVKRCTEIKTKKDFAAKFIPIRSGEDHDSVLNEMKVMRKLRHPRLLQIYDAYSFRDQMVLILELITGGELFERVIDDSFHLTEAKCMKFMREICEGVQYIHSQKIIHLDLKPENILCLTRTGFRIKIIDFGLARFWDPKKEIRVMFGTPEFVAPEVVNYEPIGPSTDLWSIGVICYVLLSGLSPFMGDSDRETFVNISKVIYSFEYDEFKIISADAKDFIKKVLIHDPKKRSTASQCLKHPWIKNDGQQDRDGVICKRRLKQYVYRRKWQKAVNAIIALRRMGAVFTYNYNGTASKSSETDTANPDGQASTSAAEGAPVEAQASTSSDGGAAENQAAAPTENATAEEPQPSASDTSVPVDESSEPTAQVNASEDQTSTSNPEAGAKESNSSASNPEPLGATAAAGPVPSPSIAASDEVR